MWSKIIPSVLGIFCLVVLIQSKVPEPDNLEDYYDCWTYAECVSTGAPYQSILGCFNSLTFTEIQPIFHYVNESFYEYHTKSIPVAIKEYCALNGDEQVNAYDKTLKGIFSYQDMACDSPQMKHECKSSEKLLTCFFSLLNKLKKQDMCKLN
ncbi:uncharacterized protein LOC129971708 [Argiope bruennichi]|uniref:Uncharacterized protein n=1 Tax=Argiope bruennichi TaxID=94029 RepID=A0A8T0DXM5_ARGBR|nr:uncharacterized protein LOC129971708 [Argiope bruennichi]KAF8763232.1 hypothetical protein HNY73_021435 [Argiope bruennichi]